MIAPLLAQLGKTLQLHLKIIHQLIVVFLGRINLCVGRRPDGCFSFFLVFDRLSIRPNPTGRSSVRALLTGRSARSVLR